jgi:hypothetical protein
MRTIVLSTSMSLIPCLTLAAQVAVAGVLRRPEALPDTSTVDFAAKRIAVAKFHEAMRRTVSITADGTIKNLVKTGEDKSPAAGSVGFVLTGRQHRISGFATVASSIDTLKGTEEKTFGRALLTPGAVGKGSSVTLEFQLRDAVKGSHYLNDQHAVRFYAGATKNTWQADTGAAKTVRDLTIVSGGARYGWWTSESAVVKGDTNTFIFGVEGGATLRSIAGDALNDNDFSLKTIGTKKTVFVGPELNMFFQIRAFYVNAHLPILFNLGDSKKVDGLTGAQLIVNVGLQTSLITF